MAESELDGTIYALSGGIAADLNALKAELSSGNLDGKAIGKLLVQLGTATSDVAGQAEAASQAKLTTLGGLLTKAGSALGGNA